MLLALNVLAVWTALSLCTGGVVAVLGTGAKLWAAQGARTPHVTRPGAPGGLAGADA